MAKAIPKYSGGNVSARIDCSLGANPPPPMPWKYAEEQQHPQRGCKPAEQRADGKERDASHVEPLTPHDGRQPATDREDDGVGDEVAGQHPGALVLPGPQVPAMCRSETLAMLVSSTSMNVAMETTIATSHGLIPGLAALLMVRIMAIRELTKNGYEVFVQNADKGRGIQRRTEVHAASKKNICGILEVAIPDADLGFDRHSRRKKMSGVGIHVAVKGDLHRHALNDFHEIPGRVFSGDDAESRAGAGLDRLDRAAKIPVGIRINLELTRAGPAACGPTAFP